MNPFDTIEKQLNSFIKDESASVLIIKGKWGIGKTYFWEEIYIKHKNPKQKKYRYISLFGINKIHDLHLILAYGKGKKYFNALKDLKQLKLLASITNIVVHSRIKDFIVCIDDIERKGEKLTINEIMGFIDGLRRKNCKIVLIFNENSFEGDDKTEFDKYREKIVDYEIEYNPSIRDNFLLIFTNKHPLTDELFDICNILSINNIRVLQKIEFYVGKLLEFFKSRTTKWYFLIEIVEHLTIFIWVHFDSENILDLELIKHDYSSSLKGSIERVLAKREKESKDEEEKPDDKEKKKIEKEKDWVETKELLKFFSAEYDLYLFSLIEKGYLDEKGFIETIHKLEENDKISNVRNKLTSIWSKYQNSFEDNLSEIITDYRTILKHIDKIKLGDFNQIINFLEENGVDIGGYIKSFVDIHGEKFVNRDINDLFLDRSPANQKLINAIVDLQKNYTYRLDLDEVTSEIAQNRGWNQREVNFLSSLSVDDFYNWMKQKHEELPLKIKRGLLIFDEPQNENNQYQIIADNTKEALKRIAKESDLNKIRVKSLYGIEVD